MSAPFGFGADAAGPVVRRGSSCTSECDEPVREFAAEESVDAMGSDARQTGTATTVVGVFISASIFTPCIRCVGVSFSRTSLLAHNVQLNVSPTYAFPNSGGRVRRGDREKASLGAEGYAREAERGIECASVDEGEGGGKVFCMEREGRVSLIWSVRKVYLVARG